MTEIVKHNLNSNNSSSDDGLIFTRLAKLEIQNNNLDRALEILEKGSHEFPNYPTPYFLCGETLLALNRIEEARKVFQKGAELLGFPDTADHYLKLIPNIEISAVQDQIEELEVEEHENGKDDLLELADKLKSAKMEVPHTKYEPPTPPVTSSPEEKQNFSSRSLVSETLARIYFSQENYKEAKEIYQTLIEIQPEREDYYKRKLAEIDSKTGITS